jgi:hypothetical protein
VKQKTDSLESEAEVLKKIDQQLKGLSPDIRAEAFQILVQRHLKGAAPTAELPGRSTRAGGRKRGGPRPVSELEVIQDLNLKKEGRAPALREFYQLKAPQAFSEHNAVFVYYLKRLKSLDGITPSHIFTCYQEVNARKPGAFYQSLLDTARVKGWINTRDTSDIRITTVGENFVEHDLPKKEKG